MVISHGSQNWYQAKDPTTLDNGLGCSPCKILPGEERSGTLLPEITHANNLRPTMETRQRIQKVIDVDSETLRLDNILKATGEELKGSMSIDSADDGKKPDHVKKGKDGPRPNS